MKIKGFLKLLRKGAFRPGKAMKFLRDFKAWQQSADPEWIADPGEFKPMLKDISEAAGSARGHYFLQDIWASQRVFKLSPSVHVDVGSRIDGFVAAVCSFCPEVRYVDIRPLESGVPNLVGVSGNICQLPMESGSVQSLSSLHVIEHIGLGRYGDPLDTDGWKKGLMELERVLAPGGQLLLGTPVGRQRVVFHAHRVFSPDQIIQALPGLRLEEFAYIPSNSADHWVDDADPASLPAMEYGCGLFRFTRPVTDPTP